MVFFILLYESFEKNIISLVRLLLLEKQLNEIYNNCNCVCKFSGMPPSMTPLDKPPPNAPGPGFFFPPIPQMPPMVIIINSILY